MLYSSPTKDRKLVPIILMLHVKKKIDLDFKSIPSGLSSGTTTLRLRLGSQSWNERYCESNSHRFNFNFSTTREKTIQLLFIC